MVYSSYGTGFDGAGSWSLGNDRDRSVVIFSVDNSSSFHADNRKNIIFTVGEGDTFGINGSFEPEKKFCINFSKANTTFYLSLHYNCDNS